MAHTPVEQPFYQLNPDAVIDAVESQGWLSDCRILELNSYENRVYQVGIEDQTPIIAKFYRPNRWSDAQILEEHDFCQQLADLEISVVPPLKSEQGDTLFSWKEYRFSLYPRRGGRAPELDNMEHLYQLGQMLGRIHALGASEPFTERPPLSVEQFGWANREYLLSNSLADSSLREAYEKLSLDILERVDSIVTELKDIAQIRVHGDCHSGNILWRDDCPHFVDFDDARTAPAIQDLWMFLTGERHEQEMQLAELVSGYEEFNSFDPIELNLVDSLRALRMINYSAWIARRWEDPAFKKAFPWFNTERYWGQHLLDLKEQYAQLEQPALRLL